MIKRTIKYTNFNNETVSEDWYFNISKAEGLELELNDGTRSLTETLQAGIEEKNVSKLFGIFKELILTAVGKRSADGSRFSKSPDVVAAFMETGACDQLVFDIMSNPGEAADFFKGMLPKEIQDQINTKQGVPVTLRPAVPAPNPKFDKPRMALADLQAMSREEFDALSDKDKAWYSNNI